MNDPIAQHDKTQIYCRKLGHHLTFLYCRTTEGSNLCPKILDCWFEVFDVRAFLEQHYTEPEIETVFKAPQPKVASLIELIEKARKR